MRSNRSKASRRYWQPRMINAYMDGLTSAADNLRIARLLLTSHLYKRWVTLIIRYRHWRINRRKATVLPTAENQRWDRVEKLINALQHDNTAEGKLVHPWKLRVGKSYVVVWIICVLVSLTTLVWLALLVMG